MGLLDTAAPTRADAPARTGLSPTRWLSIGAIVAGVAAAFWVGAALLTAGHGFDSTDEGFYLLSYRRWSTDLRTFTGVQYIYGPVFQLLGYDIAGLRLVRLVTVLGVHAVFAWAFVGWLRGRRPAAPSTRWWELAGAAAIVAGGGLIYAWLPLSPGYNDVSLLGGLLAAAIVLRLATLTERGEVAPLWLGLSLGPIIVVTMLAKWTSSALTLLVVAVVGLYVLAPRGWREVLRQVGAVLVGVLASLLLIQLLVVSLTQAIPEILATNRLVSAGTNSPTALVRMYVSTGIDLLIVIVRRHGLLLLGAVLVVLLRRPPYRWIAAGVAGLGLALSIWRLARGGSLAGGTVNLTRYPVGVVLVLLVALLVGLTVLVRNRVTGDRKRLAVRANARGLAVYALVALVPITQAAGTGNPLYYMAINGFAAWVALMVAVQTGITSAPPAARWLTSATTVGAAVLAAIIATNALLVHPYRTPGYARTTTVAAGVPALASVRLDPAQAAGYSQLHEALRPYLEPPGRAIMAFDELPGVVLALDGRSVGEAWYSALDHERAAAGIRAACADGHGWWGSRAPLLLFGRPVSEIETQALRSCGLDFETDYRLLAPAAQTMGLEVYVPTTELGRGQ